MRKPFHHVVLASCIECAFEFLKRTIWNKQCTKSMSNMNNPHAFFFVDDPNQKVHLDRRRVDLRPATMLRAWCTRQARHHQRCSSQLHHHLPHHYPNGLVAVGA
jgi:hypothetical protein